MPDVTKAISSIDAFNKMDPQIVAFQGAQWPNALLHSKWLYEKILELYPQASSELLVAARSQHIGRWLIPRASYPEGKTGYLNWRKDLAKFHAKTSGEILAREGFDDPFIARVQQINLKENLKLDADVQAMENALCLVFLEHQLEDFMELHDNDKLVTIIRKSWKKMNEVGRNAAVRLSFSPKAAQIISQAVG